MTKSTPHFRSAQKMIRRSQITGGIILIIYDSRFPGEQLWVMCSALERFETLAVSALLDTHLAMKMDTSSLKDKQQSWLLLTRGVIWPVLQCWLMLDIIWTIGHYLRGVSCSATLLGFSEFWINAYQMRSWSHLSGQGCQMHFFPLSASREYKTCNCASKTESCAEMGKDCRCQLANKQKLSFCLEKR